MQDAILDVARFWLDRGVDGFRLDVVNYFFHDRDAARQSAGACAIAARRGHRHAAPPPSTARSPRPWPSSAGCARCSTATAATHDGRRDRRRPPSRASRNTPRRRTSAHRLQLLPADRARPARRTCSPTALTAWAERAGWPSWSLGNHDVARFPTRLAPSATRAGQGRCWRAAARLRGTIFLYQGDELGLPQATCRSSGCRTPSPSPPTPAIRPRRRAHADALDRAAPIGGFSTAAETWLPVDPRHLPLAVERAGGRRRIRCCTSPAG